MPKRVGDDIDHVRSEPTKKSKKAPPPEPWEMPQFVTMPIQSPFSHGQGRLPPYVRTDDPYGIFSLFYTKSILTILVKHTNEFAELYPGPTSKASRP